jgi:predicted nucleotidyltransferase
MARNVSEGLDLDVDALRDALEVHPVRIAVVFGSEVTGRTHPRSDLDVVVEFDESVEDEHGALLSLHSTLASALDRNDVDLSLVSDLKPRVGLDAFSEGVLVVGSSDRMQTHRERFERAVESRQNKRESLRDRFDTVIEDVDAALEKRA